MQEVPEKNNQVVRLFLSRFAVTLSIFFALYWLGQAEQDIRKVLWLWLTLLTLQGFLLFPSIPKIINITAQLFADLILIGFIIYVGGGFTSPFIFLLGLVIVIAGAQASTTLPLVLAVLASATYLIAVYSYANFHDQSIPTAQGLKLLLQASLFFLTGAIMALISRRQERLLTEHKESTIEHNQLKEIHSQVLSSMHEGILIFDNNLLIQDYNLSASKTLGIKEQHKGYRLESFINLPTELLTFLKQASSNAFRFEVRKNKLNLLFSVTYMPDKPTALLMTIVDITEVRQLEQKLAEQDKLASIGQMSALLAHEIRNPMQTISQAAELMGLQQPDNKLERIITSEISRLNRLVSDMLDYANPLNPQSQPVQIEKVINHTVSLLDINNHLKINIECDNETVYIDKDHFHLVLDNLLRNAIRVSSAEGSVHIHFKVFSHGWELRIQDDGPGIDDEIKKTLFLPFQTGHKKGTGLGLATVWQVCQVNNWEVSIDETIESGACFIVTSNHKLDPETGEKLHG